MGKTSLPVLNKRQLLCAIDNGSRQLVVDSCGDSGRKVLHRGGVEDTRLEAKAKDTKKIRGQGQGQPFRGQTLSRPRSGMLEAKAKDQGHKAQVLSKKKKKVFTKIFQAISKKKKEKRSSQKFFKRSPLKNVFQEIFQALHKILTFQKIVLSSSRGQANFRGHEASRPRPRTSKSVLEDSTSGSATLRWIFAPT